MSIEEAQQKIEGIVQADEIEQSLNHSLLTVKDREAVVRARVNQGVFRERLLGNLLLGGIIKVLFIDKTSA